MYQLSSIYDDSEITSVTIGNLCIQLILPLMGHKALRMKRPVIDLSDPYHVPPLEGDPCVAIEVLAKDWYYPYTHKEALAGSLFLWLRLVKVDPADPVSDGINLCKYLIKTFDKMEARACEKPPFLSPWDEETMIEPPHYLYPKTPENFFRHTYSGKEFYAGFLGSRFEDQVPLSYYCPITEHHYLEFLFSPSGFPIEDFGSKANKEAFIQAQAHEFMSKIRITRLADHPVCA